MVDFLIISYEFLYIFIHLCKLEWTFLSTYAIFCIMWMVVTSKIFSGLQKVLTVINIPPSSLDLLVDFLMTCYTFYTSSFILVSSYELFLSTWAIFCKMWMVVTSKIFSGLQKVLKVFNISLSSLGALLDFLMTSYAFSYIFNLFKFSWALF